MRIRYATALLATIILAAGCSSSKDGVGPTNILAGNGAPPPPVAGVGSFKALFVANYGIFPYPTDLYFNGSTDGTLNIPAEAAVFPQRAAMNELDGFSTTASSYFRMSEPVKNDPVVLNSSIRVIRAQMLRQSNGVYAPIGVTGVLQPGVDYDVTVSGDVDTGGKEVEIKWLKPLSASSGTGLGTGYIVLVTDGLVNTSDVAATPDSDFMTVRTEAMNEIGHAIASGDPSTYLPTCPGITDPTLNGICRLTYAHLLIGSNPALGPAAVNPANVILSYSFTTESTRDALVMLSQTETAEPIASVKVAKVLQLARQLPAEPPFTTSTMLAANGSPPNPACPGCADVYTGMLQIPYYLSPPSAADPTAPLTKAWMAAGPSDVPGIDPNSRAITRFNLMPKDMADLKIPLLIFVPNGNSPSGGVKPANGWPVVVFMHGITRSRLDTVAIADSYASAGFVVVAMDQVLHGVTDTTNLFYAGPANPLAAYLYGPDVRERTFDVDYQNNTTGAPGPDGLIDSSGANVINLTSPLVVRDGLRQTGSDMITLAKSLANLDLDGVPGGDIDMTRVHYAGISLGGIVGPACVCSQMKSYYLNVPGAPLPDILRTSPTFAPRINAGLAAVNPLLVPGYSLYSQFFRELKAVWDAGDPANYIVQLVHDRPVLFSKVIGDSVVPNGTNDYLINAAGATKITNADLNLTNPPPYFVPVAAGAPRYVTFLNGGHGSLLDPSYDLNTTVEMQREAVSLVGSGGAGIYVFDPSLLEQ